MRKASTRLPEQGTQAPSPAPDLIPAETENQPRTYTGIGTANGGTSEPARTITATAALTGLRLSELRGIRWEDYNGRELLVRRSVWRTNVGDTKTPESKASVPVIEPLRKMLDAHRKRNGSDEWIFSGEKKGFALNLDNLARREIMPKVKDRWHGWHGWRRGLSTTLFGLGVDPEIAARILRHADSATTRRHYLVLNSLVQGRKAMRKLAKVVAKKGANGVQRKARKSRKTA
jgi:integrase